MKKKFVLSTAILCILLSSCGMQKFTVGDTSGAIISTDKRKMVHLFVIIPIGRKQAFPTYADAKGYEIITKHNFVDWLVTGLTVGIVDMKTVKFKATK